MKIVWGHFSLVRVSIFPLFFSKIEWGFHFTTPALSYPLYTVINTVVPPATSAPCDNYCGRSTWNGHFQINFTKKLLSSVLIFLYIIGINSSVSLPLLFLKSLFHSVYKPTLPPPFISTPCCCIWTSSKPLPSHLLLSHLQLYFSTAHFTTNQPYTYVLHFLPALAIAFLAFLLKPLSLLNHSLY